MDTTQLAEAMRSLTPIEKVELARGLAKNAHTAKAPKATLRTVATLLRAAAGEFEVIALSAPVGE